MELEAAEAAAAADSRSSSGKKKYKLNKKQFIKFLICIFLKWVIDKMSTIELKIKRYKIL